MASRKSSPRHDSKPNLASGSFPDSEAPTKPQRIEHRAAALLRNWISLSDADKRRVESFIELVMFARE